MTGPGLESLEARDCPSVTYGGGPLLTAPVVHAVFYGAGWFSDPRVTATGFYFASALDDVVQSPYTDGLAQYGIGRGTHGVNEVVPWGLSGRGWLDDSAVRAAVRSVSAGAAPDSLWVVFTPPGVAVTYDGFNSQGAFYGYHSAAWGGDFARPYAVIPWPGPVDGSPWSNLGDGPLGQTALVTHELVEAMTDPLGDGWRDRSVPGAADEIADLAKGLSYWFRGYEVQDYVGADGQPVPRPE